MESGHHGWAGAPVAFPAEVEPDKGHASVQAPPLNMEEGSAKAMMSTLTSATVNRALVSFHLNTHVKYTQLVSQMQTFNEHEQNNRKLYFCYLRQFTVTGAPGAPGAAAAGPATEAKCGVTERVTIPDRPMGVDHVPELTRRSRNAARWAALVKPLNTNY